MCEALQRNGTNDPQLIFGLCYVFLLWRARKLLGPVESWCISRLVAPARANALMAMFLPSKKLARSAETVECMQGSTWCLTLVTYYF